MRTAWQRIDMYVHKEKYMLIPYIEDDRIKNIVERLYNYDISDGLKLDIEKLCAFLVTVYPVKFDFEHSLSNGVLGKIEFNPLKITVTSNLQDDLQRFRFTLAHEIGHLILHYKLLQTSIIEKIDDENSLAFNKALIRIRLKDSKFRLIFLPLTCYCQRKNCLGS